MDSQQLRELIRTMAQPMLMRVLQQFLGKGEAPIESGDAKRTGVARFIPWLRKDREDSHREPEFVQPPSSEQPQRFGQPPQNRVDDIIRSVMPDWVPPDQAANQPAVVSPGGSSESGQSALSRVDDIIRSIIPDWTPAEEQDPEKPSPQALQSIITGAVEKQDQVQAGQAPPIQQPEVPGVIAGTQPEEKPITRTQNAMDAFQLVLDGIGVVDPTPITDGANAAISLGRAFVTDPERRKEHLQNAAISAVSMIPYAGDTAKVAKLPRAAKTVKRTAQAVRGVDRATDGAKVMTASQKRAARDSYRDTAQQVTAAAMGDDDRSNMEETAAAQGTAVAGGGSGGGTVPPTGVGTPDPGDGRPRSLHGARQEVEGIQEYDSWKDKLKNAGEKVLDFAGILGKGAGKVAAFVGSLNLLNTGVLALNRDLAAYNGEIATAYAKADAADIRRDMRRADTLSGSLSGLSEQQSRLRDNLDDALLPLTNVAIRTLEEITRYTNEAMEFIGAMINIVPGLKDAIEIAKKLGADKQNDSTAWMQFFQDVADGKFDGQRPSFVNPKKQILDDQDHNQVFGP